jgi:isopenicillin N synthase-like dioxygenase
MCATTFKVCDSTSSTLPVIDVSALYSNRLEDRQRLAAEMGRAARENGFFYVKGHGVPRELRQRLVTQAKALFALPLERKMEMYIGLSNNHRGYVPQGEEVFAGGTKT